MRAQLTRDGTRRVEVRLGGGKDYRIEIAAGALEGIGAVARGTLSPHAQRIVVVSNAKVFGLYGERVAASLRGAEFDVATWLMGDGERHKSWRTLERTLAFFGEKGLGRSDAVIALGGGVVGDLAGFAAAVYLRGIAYLQVPTTLLAQIDSSVGGKTGVNTRTGKNLIGAFHQPRGVVIDTATLRTLPPREMTAGWCEAIKQGAAGDRHLFERTHQALDVRATAGRASVDDDGSLADLIAAQCAFKAKIVANDEREEIGRTDHRSRRILNFGHTVAHALEALTGYRRFRHGEAVGYGMLAAGELSVGLGLLAPAELESLRRTVRLAGRLPRADDLALAEILRALPADKKSVGGHVQWVLLEKIGRARIISDSEIGARLLRSALRAALARDL